MQTSLSGKDVIDLVIKTTGKEPNILSYGDLENFSDIDKILKNNMCILLYESSRGYGHWTCIFKTKDDIVEHFDSYGLFPDAELKFSDKNLKGQDYPNLGKLLYECPYEIRYSHGKFQGENSSTCGRWVATRLWFRDVDEYVFEKLFKDVGDDGIVKITKILGEF